MTSVRDFITAQLAAVEVAMQPSRRSCLIHGHFKPPPLGIWLRPDWSGGPTSDRRALTGLESDASELTEIVALDTHRDGGAAET
jgi:hypothetical protein